MGQPGSLPLPPMSHYGSLGPVINAGQFPPGVPSHIGHMMGYPFPPNMKMEALPDMMAQHMDGLAGMDEHMSPPVSFASPPELNSLTVTNLNTQNGQNHLELMHDMLNSF